MHDPSTGELTGEIPAILPPTLDFTSTFQPFHVASSFAQSAITYPVLTLPPWIYLDSSPRWHAILYSGASMNRHVNDIEFLYRTLVNSYAIPAANITVLNYDGTLDYNDAYWMRVTPPVGNWPGDNTPYQMKVKGSGTKQALLDAIAAVGKKLGPNDNLLIHTNNHGNRVNDVSTIISYSGDDTTPTDLANAIQALPKFSSLMVMMEQCYSGAFVQPILDVSSGFLYQRRDGCGRDPHLCGRRRIRSLRARLDLRHGACESRWLFAWVQSRFERQRRRIGPRRAFDYALATDLGVGDTPQYGENSFCGGEVTLSSRTSNHLRASALQIFVPLGDYSRSRTGADRADGCANR